MSQLTTIASTIGAFGCFRCPYQAKVMKVFETKSRVTVRIAIKRTSARAQRITSVRELPARAMNCSSGRAGLSSNWMPIFEYECLLCGQVGAYVVLGSERRPRPACEHCESKKMRRVMSSFAVHQSE